MQYECARSRSTFQQSNSLWKEAADKSVSSTFMTDCWEQFKECVERVGGVQCSAPAAALEEFFDKWEGNSDDPLSSSNYSLQGFFV